MGLGVDVRIDAQADRCDFARVTGNPVKAAKFAFGLDVKAEYAGIEGRANFRCSLADTGKNDFFRIAAGFQDARKLAAYGRLTSLP